MSTEEDYNLQAQSIANDPTLDDFDRYTIIKRFFYHFTKGQKQNLLNDLQEMLDNE